MSFTVVLPTEYPLTLLACTILTVECFMLGPALIGPARFRAFPKEFMDQFKEEHESAFPGSEPAVGGFPDCGDGRYSKKLDYKSWVEFNNAMRVHQNFVESLPLMLVILLVAGLYFPFATAAVGLFNTFTRLVYICMYVKKGSDARVIGAVAGSGPLYLLGLITFGAMVMEAFKDESQVSL